MNKYLHRFLEFCLLNIVITVGLMPLIAWHFNKITPYGLIGNMLFSFIFSLGIMPLLFIGCLFMPLGWADVFFKIAGYLLESIEKGTSFLVQLPFSQINVASFERFWLCLMIAGIIALCLGHYWGKRFGVILLLIGLAGAFQTTSPDLIISNHSIGYIQNNTFYQNKSGDSWLQNLWRQKLGLSKFQEIDLPQILTIKNKKIALSTSSCLGADYAILPYRDSRCHIPTLIPQKDQVYLIYIQNKQIKMTPLTE